VSEVIPVSFLLITTDYTTSYTKFLIGSGEYFSLLLLWKISFSPHLKQDLASMCHLMID